MSISEIKRPVLRSSNLVNSPKALVIEYCFVSGPERTENKITVSKEEYESLLKRISQDNKVLNAIIKNWRDYASVLRKLGDTAESPIGTYHKRFAELCDQDDPNRGAILATVFGEKIESDILHRYINKHEPPWSAEFSVEKRES